MDLGGTSTVLCGPAVEFRRPLLCTDCAREGMGGGRDYSFSDLDLVVFPPTVTLGFRALEALVVHDAIA
jgi:hypothetical protein